MRIDPAHARKISSATTKSETGKLEVNFDLSFMQSCMSRLSLWERGLLVQALIRASTSKRKTIEQRVILAMFVHQDDTP